MVFESIANLKDAIRNIVDIERGFKVLDPERLRGDLIDELAFTAALAEHHETRDAARWIVIESANKLGLWLASIQELYEARGREEFSGVTVPAVNIRGLTYDVARAIFRARKKLHVGAMIFEIAKSEIGYTMQRPMEYTAVVAAAGIKEGFQGPLFMQGDHYQVKAKAYRTQPEREIQQLKDLIDESIAGGFFNIDLDTSTLVDLSKETVFEQQRDNFALAAELCAYVRSKEPEDVSISLGGEIGEVGGKNSTAEELAAYMEGFFEELGERGPELVGISKMAIQTGTAHGGVPLPDGSIAEVALDFDTLESLSAICREDYGLAGAVQHGASTLPDELFDKFPEVETAEIHLATGFQNTIYDHEAFPKDLKNEIYAWIHKNLTNERKQDQTSEQFIYKTRKKGFGPFKKKLWSMERSIRDAICRDLQDRFEFMFEKLGALNTQQLVSIEVRRVDVPLKRPECI
ncbi:MAG: class II fructose-bisphosphate aldolase [Candidatus Coatesbacteria bacterium]|nr:class II fructose-bisphosphate aldolase [Candidatus Coatesbacteria bacterium]